MKYFKLLILFPFLVVNCTSYASAAMSFNGVSTHEISVNPANKNENTPKKRWQKAIKQVIELNHQSKKNITVINVNLSGKAQEMLASRIASPKFIGPTFQTTVFTNTTTLSKTQLGMNEVPVLDQGSHGSCATFAVTAAIDAIKRKGDYYSQLCLLNLGKSLAKYGYGLSGWNGLEIESLFPRIKEFGLISKANQKTEGCGGITEYPTHSQDTSTQMSLEDYHAMSVPSSYSGFSSASTIMSPKKWINKEVSATQLLSQIKQTLSAGNRIVMGVLLPMNETLGASNKYHSDNDTWLITNDLVGNGNWGGHAMVITGYNDEAVVTDAEGIKHHGLITLRNSWGSEAGDHGDYYMSYDYLFALGFSMTEVVKIP